MIELHQSDTGQFVLLHRPSGTVVVDESLESAYARLDPALRASHPDWAAPLAAEAPKADGDRTGRLAQLVLLIFLALLPFLWLVVLHHSLTALITDVQFGGGDVTESDVEFEASIREEVDLLRVEFNRVLGAMHNLNIQVMKLVEAKEAEEKAAAEHAEADSEGFNDGETGAPEEGKEDAAESAAPDAAGGSGAGGDSSS